MQSLNQADQRISEKGTVDESKCKRRMRPLTGICLAYNVIFDECNLLQSFHNYLKKDYSRTEAFAEHAQYVSEPVVDNKTLVRINHIV